MLDSIPPKKPWENDQPFIVPSMQNEQVQGTQNHQIYTSNYGVPTLNQNQTYYSYGPGGHNVGGYYGPMRPSFGANIPILRNLESGTSSIMEHLQGLVNVVTGIAQFLDSTVYAGWSSINALGMVAANFKTIKDFLYGLISRTLKLLRLINMNNNAARILLLATATSIPFTLKIIMKTFNTERFAFATAIHSYEPSEEGHLTLKAGDRIKIIYSDGDWTVGEDTAGMRGYFPSSYANINVRNLKDDIA